MSINWGQSLTTALLTGPVVAAANFFAIYLSSDSQVVISDKDRSVQVQIEKDKLQLGRDQLKLDTERYNDQLARDRQQSTSERRKLQIEIELQNKRLLAEAWSSCLTASAQIMQPVAVPGPATGAFGSAGEMYHGKDKIGCLKKFDDFQLDKILTKTSDLQ